MSKAEDLLNTLSDEEIMMYSVSTNEDPHIVIGADRTVTVPNELKKIAVQYDHNVETVTFDCPRYSDGVDMSEMTIYVNYMRPDGYKDAYPCNNIVVDDTDPETMHFDWTITRNATQVPGNLRFLVCVKKTDVEGNDVNHWNSDLCSEVRVGEGLECEEQIEQENPDTITAILTRLETIESESLGTPDESLTMSGAPADSKVVGDKIGELKSDLTNLTETTKNKFTRDIIVSENGFKFENNIISNNLTDTKTYTAIKLYGKKDNVTVETYATNKELTIGNNVFYFNVTQDIDTLVFLHSGSARDLYFTFDVSKFIEHGYNSFSFTAESVNPSVVNGVRLTKVQFENGGQTSFEYPISAYDRNARLNIAENSESIVKLSNEVQKNKQHFKNNLINEFEQLPYAVDIFKNGESSESNYGSDNVRYRFTLDNYEKIHGFFEFKFTKAVPFISTNTMLRLFSIGNNAVTGGLYLNKPSINNGYVYRGGLCLQENAYIGTTSKEFSVFTTNSFKGNDAFYVKYLGGGTNATMKIESNKITFKNGDSTLAVVSFGTSDSIDSLITKLKALDIIEVGFVDTIGKTCGDLLPDADLTIALTYTFDGVIDRPRVYIPYAYDEKWHTVEFIFDKSIMKSYVAFDGLTVESSVSPNAFGTYNDMYLSIGGMFNGSESPIKLRNLVIDINSYGDAEIVDSKASPYTSQKQLVSSHNPRLLIFEGHGIDVRMDSDAIPDGSDDMACSTDRLMRVFEELTIKGYVPVTYEQIVDWKINGKSLPKRCFNLMFDDYRIENYLDDRKRFPFSKYNVKAGLAIISDEKEMNDNVNVDGTIYTVSEAFNAIKNGGWHPCSHTNSHTPIDDVLPSALPQKLKDCVVSANKHNIYSDVIVYPFGKISTRSLSSLENSDFSIGINIVTDRYNCRALPNMNLTRVEIGTREPIDKVLETIV